jgi:hypothetical protein
MIKHKLRQNQRGGGKRANVLDEGMCDFLIILKQRTVSSAGDELQPESKPLKSIRVAEELLDC